MTDDGGFHVSDEAALKAIALLENVLTPDGDVNDGIFAALFDEGEDAAEVFAIVVSLFALLAQRCPAEAKEVLARGRARHLPGN